MRGFLTFLIVIGCFAVIAGFAISIDGCHISQSADQISRSLQSVVGAGGRRVAKLPDVPTTGPSPDTQPDLTDLGSDGSSGSWHEFLFPDGTHVGTTGRFKYHHEKSEAGQLHKSDEKASAHGADLKHTGPGDLNDKFAQTPPAIGFGAAGSDGQGGFKAGALTADGGATNGTAVFTTPSTQSLFYWIGAGCILLGIVLCYPLALYIEGAVSIAAGFLFLAIGVAINTSPTWFFAGVVVVLALGGFAAWRLFFHKTAAVSATATAADNATLANTLVKAAATHNASDGAVPLDAAISIHAPPGDPFHTLYTDAQHALGVASNASLDLIKQLQASAVKPAAAAAPAAAASSAASINQSSATPPPPGALKG